jgi:hypothetical protein
VTHSKPELTLLQRPSAEESLRRSCSWGCAAKRIKSWAFSLNWSAIRAGAVARPCRETAADIY